jgi:membrane protease YdiL (CAAX protease family)
MSEDLNPAIVKRQYNTIILAGIGIALLFHPVVGTLVISKNILPMWRLVISSALTWICLPVLYQYAIKVENRPFLLWQERRRSLVFFILSLVVLFILIAIANLIANIPHRLGFQDDFTVMKYWNGIIKQNKIVLFFICISAGVTEELLIRGYILPRLSCFLNLPTCL